MGGCEGGRESPCTFNFRKNRNIFQCFGFCFSSCRHFVDSLRAAESIGGPWGVPGEIQFIFVAALTA
jgi:hypothetical protein